MDKRRTLVIPIDQHRVLLGLKKRGFGEGKITAFGGKIEANETIEQSAVRELEEETGLRATSVQQAGTIQFYFPARPGWNLDVTIYTVQTWHGQLRESDEVIPAWYAFDAIPYDRMWDDARYWLPSVLAGQQIAAQFTFNADNETVCEHRVEVK